MLGESNVGEERTCSYCGHRCHCYSSGCPECMNDVCQKCDCGKDDIPVSYTHLRAHET